MLKDRKHLLYIFSTALIFCISINELNIQYIKSINNENKKLNAKSLVHSRTVWSIDNLFYLTQIKHMLNGDGYTLDPNEPEMKVRRTPVYPLFYGIQYYLFGEEKAHIIIPYIQSIFFAISAVLITLIILYTFGNEQWAKVTGYSYAFLPFISSFCYFTLTESISPFLVVLSMFFFANYLRDKSSKNLIICGIVTGVSFLNRPTAGVVIVGFFLQLLFNKGVLASLNVKIKTMSILAFSFILSLSPWIIRNYLITGDIVVAETFYHEAPMDFGKAHIELRKLTSCWTNPTNLPTEKFSNELRLHISQNEPYKNDKVIDDYIDQWPNNAFNGYTRQELKLALHELNNCFIEKYEFLKNNPNAMRKDFLNRECEEQAYNNFKILKERFIKTAPFRYYIITPLTINKEIAFNSFIHHFAIINPIDNEINSLQIFLKSLVYILNVLCFLSPIYFCLFSKFSLDKVLLIMGPIFVLILTLTAIIFRYVESRYIIVIYPYFIITFSFMLIDILNRIKSKKTKLLEYH